MVITYLELHAKDLMAQKEYYSEVLGLHVKLSAEVLEVQVGKTDLVFTQSDLSFDGAYHFAFNIPENQFQDAKGWIEKSLQLGSNMVLTMKRTLSRMKFSMKPEALFL